MSLSIVVFGLGSSSKRLTLTSHIKLIQVRRLMLFFCQRQHSLCVSHQTDSGAKSYLGWWGELGRRGLQVPSGNKGSVCCARSRPKHLISFFLTTEKGSELTRPSRGKTRLTLVAAVSLSLHLGWSVSLHGLFVSSVQPGQRLCAFKWLSCLVSLFCCFLNCNLPGTWCRDKEESARPLSPFLLVNSMKNPLYKVMHLDKWIALSCINTDAPLAKALN